MKSENEAKKGAEETLLPQHDRARVLPGTPREVHRPVVSDHDLLDEIALPQADAPGVVEG